MHIARILKSLPIALVLFSSWGFSQDFIQEDLVLDLNADIGVTTEEKNMVTTWTNQAPHAKAIDFTATEEGRTKTIISQEVLGTGRPTLLRQSQEINGHDTLIFREDELINDNDEAFHGMMTGGGYTSVSYTHLTLPTIYSV